MPIETAAAPPATLPATNGQHTDSYFEHRMSQLGITAALNRVMLWRNNPETQKNELQPIPVFRDHAKGIEIVPYTLGRSTIRIEKEGSKIKKDWSIIRLQQPLRKDDGDTMKYLMPRSQGSHPLYSPNILDAYDKRSEIHTLILTEGFFKAWKGYMAGLHIIGLPSITHMKDKEKKTIHPEILDIIDKCNVRHVIWLTDGDALDISQELETTDALGNKKLKDLYKRPNSFYHSIDTFGQLLYDKKEVRKYWAYIDIEAIIQRHQNKFTRDEIKGLDDLLVALPEEQHDIIADLLAVSKPGDYFNKFDITVHTAKVREHFHLDNPLRFYLYHRDHRPDLRDKEFVFHGTQYKYNEEKGECDVVVPARAKDYFRCGNDYYKNILKPNKYGQLEKYFRGRLKGVILEDHGKDFVKHIPKYEDFCNVPSNTNYQQVIHNCYNLYSPLEYAPYDEPCTQEDCPTIISFLHHLFGERTVTFKHPRTHIKHEYTTIELGLDYLQIAYKQPAEKLPILCLVSKENNTGKSTFGKLLRTIFGSNTAIVGNQDIAGDFNAHWASKLFVVCDESKIDKQHVVEKVKSLSTADKITMNAKGKDHVEIDCFIKFIFITNHEDNFIYMTDEDIRYWIIKVPVLKDENPAIVQRFVEEIPAFLSYLNQRQLKTEQLNRMWFHPTLLRTEAMKKVVDFSRSTAQKEIRQRIRDMFIDFGLNEIMMTRTSMHKEFFNNRYEANYIEKVLKEEMKVEQYYKIPDPNDKDLYGNPAKKYVPTRHTYPKWDEVFKNNTKTITRVEVECNGRPYVFKREDYLSAEELEKYKADQEQEYINSQTPGSNTGAQPADDELPF